MALTLQEQLLLEEELKHNGNRLARAVNVLGIKYEDALEYIDRKPTSIFKPNPRPELEQYVVSSRKVTGPWPDKDESKIAQARSEYDAGVVEMCQWRDGDTINLLAIPRKWRARPRSYFSTMVEALA